MAHQIDTTSIGRASYASTHRAIAAQWGEGDKLKARALELVSAV